MLMTIYDTSAIEPYNSKGLQSRRQRTLQDCIGRDKYINVLQQVCSDLLPCHLIQYLVLGSTHYVLFKIVVVSKAANPVAPVAQR